MSLLQGGKEASKSNAILHKIITETIQQTSARVGKDLIGLVTSREDVDDLLQLDDVIDLVTLQFTQVSGLQPSPVLPATPSLILRCPFLSVVSAKSLPEKDSTKSSSIAYYQLCISFLVALR